MFTNLQYGGTMPFAKTWRCADRVFDLSARPLIMGILNVTPDSFSDGGDHNKLDDAVAGLGEWSLMAPTLLTLAESLRVRGPAQCRLKKNPAECFQWWRRSLCRGVRCVRGYFAS